MAEQEPTYKLILNPDRDYSNNAELKDNFEKNLLNYEYVAKLIGKAKGWGGNPRWDLIIEKGLESLINEKD
ncbi:hypothetical protein GW932_04185 [archaeon]|nr:hypothetical protein [archaeon]